MLFFCMGLGLVASKNMFEALVFRPQSVLVYVMDNDVCHVCDGCHLTKMSRMMAEFGHKTKREPKIFFGSFTHNPARNSAHNPVIPYWIDRHRTIHTDVPGELNDLTFAEKQLIALDRM
jgi:hypothetical protein